MPRVSALSRDLAPAFPIQPSPERNIKCQQQPCLVMSAPRKNPTDRSQFADTRSPHSSEPFRFKSKHSQPHTEEKHHDRHNSRRHKRRRKVSDPLSSDKDGAAALSPETAFRESLFDAMGDDEGAAYWENVYGQPIHSYPNERWNEETGKLEKMSDDEYIAYVRRGMWEKSREGIEALREERKSRRRMRERSKRGKEQGSREKTRDQVPGARDRGAGNRPFDVEIEESLRRGLERRERKAWREKWNNYERAWDDLHQLVKPSDSAVGGADDTSTNSNNTIYLRNKIHWPVESGKRKDLGPVEIERFMTKTAESLVDDPETGESSTSRQLLSNLKSERVRWHPDKVQQRFGTLNIDEGTLKGVTEVFQVVDRLYGERRKDGVLP